MKKCRNCAGSDVVRNETPDNNGGKYIEYDCPDCGDFWTKDIAVYKKNSGVCKKLQSDVEEGIRGDQGLENHAEFNHVELYPA